MATIDDNREQQQNSNITREPLIDLTVETAQPGGRQAEGPDGSGPAYKSLRRCLSDLQGKSSKSGDECPIETPNGGSQSQAASDGLIDLTTPSEKPSPAERPRQPSMRAVAQESVVQTSDPQPMNEVPVVEQPEYQPKPSRPRLTHGQSQTETSPATSLPEAPARGRRPRLGQERVQPTTSGAGTPPLSDMARLEQSVNRLRAKQNLTLALVGVLAAAVAGLLAWVVFTALAGSPIG